MLRGFTRFLIVLAVIAGIAFGGYLLVMNRIETHTYVAIDENASPDDYYVLEIVPGMRATEVIDILYEEELIRNSTIAGLLVRFRGWGAVQVGEYHVHAGLSLYEMFSMFQDGDIAEQMYTYVIIPEGILIPGIADLFGEELDIDPDDFIELWADVAFLTELIEEYWFLTDEILNPELLYPLEGYITPIRHEIPVGEEDLREITRAILSMTERRLAEYDIQSQVEDQEWTFHEILSFAAIIEGETQDLDEKQNVSGVFHNRLEAGWRLESDVSAQYLAPEREERVNYDMLEIESPFNTYRNHGLPIGPMNNPSIASIQAVMNPASHDYFFFISDMYGCAGEVGSKMYSVTYEEHRERRDRYLNHPYFNDGECL